MNKIKERYMAIIMNDGGLPYILLTDDLDTAKQFTSGYVQHYIIKDLQEDRFIIHSDYPELEVNNA